MSARFTASLVPVPHGGHYVVVPPEAAEKAKLKHGDRVRGTVGGRAYRSSMMKYSGLFHLGVHKEHLAALGATTGDRLAFTIEVDAEPLPGDEIPPELARALKKNTRARDGFEAMAPSHRREHVKYIVEAKKPETRARRVEKTIEACEEKARTITTARPPRRRK
jgi:hypothetical protein